MTAGDTVFVATPICLSDQEPRGIVRAVTVVMVGDRGEIVAKDECGISTYGKRFDLTRVFATEAEAWGHCAEELRQRAGKIAAAAAACEEKALS